ncbi:hypothetical protein [Cellulomonas hominis]
MELAAKARYEPSAEHKGRGHDFPGVGSRLRTDATECPAGVTLNEIQRWLREALEAGDVGGIWEPDTYPQLVWRRVDGGVFEGRVSNRDLGWYHGYPITPAEAPSWLR